jgi:hypothetical protein
MAQIAVHKLASSVVLDNGVFQGLTNGGKTEVIDIIRGLDLHKPLYVIDDAKEFFSVANLVNLIAIHDKSYLIVNEGLGGFFTQAQIDALTGQKVIQPAAIKDDQQQQQYQAPLAAAKGYTFAPVPEGWSVNAYMSLGPTKIKRKMKNPEGDGTLFFMSPKDFEKLWFFASSVWSGQFPPNETAKFNTGVGVKKALVVDDLIDIGGNFIRRYEIEQVAKYRGWAMPQLQAA